MLIIFAYAIMILTYIFFENAISYLFIKYLYEADLNDLLFLLDKQDLNHFQEVRYKKASRMLFCLLFIPLLNFNLYLTTLIVFVSLFEYKRPYFKLKRLHQRRISEVRFQFPIWLRQIQILLYNNNVLNAIEISLKDAPQVMQAELETLIGRLRINPNDINAFSIFMTDYRVQEIERAMKLLYRAYVVDHADASLQLDRMILSTTKWMREERVSRHSAYLSKFEWIGIIPLFGVTMIFLVMMASLINNLFGKGVSL